LARTVLVLAPGDLTAMTAKISATIEIAAPPEQVWAVLADLAGLNVQTGTRVVVYNKGDNAAPKGQS
jgi:ligand-binding SRPBCC domain-containing protein